MNVVNKYKNMPNSIKATIVFAIASFTTSGINYVTTPIFTRLLSTAEYGLISIYNSWYEIIRVFASLTLIFPGVLNVGLYEHKENRWGYLSAILGLTTLSTMIVSFFYFVFRPVLDYLTGLPTILMVLLLLTCLFQPATVFWTFKQRYEIKYRITFSVSVGSAFLAQVVSVVMVYVFRNSNNNLAVIRLWSAGLVNLFVALYIYIYICRQGKMFANTDIWKVTVLIAIPLIPHYLSTVVLSSIDKIMINQIIGQEKTGIYSLSAILSAMGVLVWRALSVTYTPFINEKLGKKDYCLIRKCVKPLLLVVAVFCVATSLAAPEIIHILATEEYVEGIYVIPPIAAGIFTVALYDNYTAISFFYKKTVYIMVATVISALVNVLLNWIFIRRFGYIAAGYTTLVSNIILTICHYVSSRIVLKERVYDDKFAMLLLLAVVGCCLMCNLLYGFFITRYFILFLCLSGLVMSRKQILKAIEDMKL